jgi:prepilin-type N-terminal cleavage/methylation domain-containing protein
MAVMKWARTPKGFTIVELLIVIVVIAILATIAVVAYTNVTRQAKASSYQNEIASAMKKIESLKTESGTDTYPTSIASFGFSPWTAYYYSSKDNTYCVERTDRGDPSGPVYSGTSDNNAPQPVPCSRNGLMAWWKLNANSGEDSSEAKLNGQLFNTNTIGSHSGATNRAIELSSANSSYMYVGNSDALNDAKTFAFWIRPTSWASTTASSILAKRNSSANGFFLAYVNVLDTFTVDCGGSPSNNRWPTNYKPTFNTWAHVVVTCSNEDGLKLYVNGELRDQRSTVNRAEMKTSTANLYVGRDSTSSGTFYFNGGLDDIRIYSRVLTPGEATAIYTENAQ